nr:LOW QUALITY PROTEIN: doublecortin domain-containing protein 2C [Aotus nancymaae]
MRHLVGYILAVAANGLPVTASPARAPRCLTCPGSPLTPHVPGLPVTPSPARAPRYPLTCPGSPLPLSYPGSPLPPQLPGLPVTASPARAPRCLTCPGSPLTPHVPGLPVTPSPARAPRYPLTCPGSPLPLSYPGSPLPPQLPGLRELPLSCPGAAPLALAVTIARGHVTMQPPPGSPVRLSPAPEAGETSGQRCVLSRGRTTATLSAAEQLTSKVDVPSGVRRLFTATRGRPVLALDALQAGGKYVAAGRERFQELHYIHIVPRKPAKIRKLKEIKPVVHCDINVPSKWQTYPRISRHINVFTNGRLFIPPSKIIIPKFSLSDWDIVLSMIGEKVFPLGGVRKLFTMDGHLLDNSKDLQDNHFYVAAGLETFKYFPYWKSPRVPSEVLQRYANVEKHLQRKKKVDSKGKEPPKYDGIPPKTQDSVYHAKEEKKNTLVEPLVERGGEGDVYKAPTPSKETQGALEVKEDGHLQLAVPVDQRPAEIVKEDEEIHENTPDFEGDKMAPEWKPVD